MGPFLSMNITNSGLSFKTLCARPRRPPTGINSKLREGIEYVLQERPRNRIERQIIRLIFFGAFLPAVLGMALSGINKGAQDTLFKAAITGLIPLQRRSTAFEIFDTAFGVAWLAGSICFGLLYERSVPAWSSFQ